jgi:hypothetical protein
MKTAIKFTLMLLVVASGSFAQTKKELIDQIAKQQKTIDSLNAVISNMENIIENRDRSIQIYVADEEKLKKGLSDHNIALENARNQTASLRRQNAYGQAKMISMSNNRSVLKVKEGMVMTVNQFMGDYTASVSTDSTGNPVLEEIHVFIKEINGTVLTDIASKKFGPKLYSSLHPEASIHLPMVLPAGNVFKIAVFKGTVGNLTPYDGAVLCSYTEKEV